MLVVIILTVLILGQLSIGALLLAEYVSTKRRDQLIFFVLALVTSVWMASTGALIAVDLPGSAQYETLLSLANKLAFACSVLVGMLVLAFGFTYPIHQKWRGSDRALLAVGALLVIASVMPIVAGNFAVSGNDLVYSYSPGVVALGLFVVACVVRTVTAQRRVLRTHPGDERLSSQVHVLQLGMLLTFLHALTFLVLLPLLFGQNPLFYVVGCAAPGYLIVLTTYGLVRQRLFEVRIFAARSLAYVLTFGVVLVLYMVSATLLLTSVFNLSLDANTVAVLAVMSMTIALVVRPLKGFFDKITNRFFFRDYYNLQDIADQIGQILVQTVDLSIIKARSTKILEDALKAQFVDIILVQSDNEIRASQLNALPEGPFDPRDISGRNKMSLRKYLLEKDAVIAVRLRTGDRHLGLMVFGRRKSGEPYGSHDQRVIGTLAGQLSVGLQNALQFEEIQQFNETLQQKIDDATAKLRQANERLKVLNETKDDFVSMASHQLRTPLTSIKGYLSMVLEGDMGKITAGQRKMIEQAFTSSQRMAYLISDLLNMSRLRTGRLTVTPGTVSLNKIIEQEIAQLRRMAEGNSIKLVVEEGEELPPVALDETKIRQVIMNLVDNAIYYTGRGGTVTVRLSQTPKTVELRVIDTGIGVPVADQHKLFTRFYRAGNAKKVRPDGTGIGLYMVRKVVTALGGSIIFSSKEGKGSTFGFSFPKVAPKVLPTVTSADN